MPRTRSQASPPPRRSGAERPSRSVRQLTHPPTRAIKVQKPVEKRAAPTTETAAEAKHALIQRHAEARAMGGRANFGPIGIVGVALTCLAVFVAWWFLPDVFSKSEPTPPLPSAASQPATLPAEAVIPAVAPSSTERRLLLPLISTSSTNRIN